MVFSQQVSHRALLELGNSSTSITRYSKMPNANRTFLKPSSVGYDTCGRPMKYKQIGSDETPEFPSLDHKSQNIPED